MDHVPSPPSPVPAESPEPTPPARRTARTDPRTTVREAVVREVLDEAVERAARAAGRPLDVVDIGGGTGGFAVPLAIAGHRVTVIDPSPDALAALQRRAEESEVSQQIGAIQGDAGDLARIVGTASADVVLCHGVLEYADDPAAGISDAVAVLRSGGLLSVLAQQRLGAVVARALAGRFGEARQVLQSPQGRLGEHDLRRFDREQLLSMLAAAGIPATGIVAVHGVRVFADLLPGSLPGVGPDADPDTGTALLDLERIAGAGMEYPELSALAAQLHVLAQRPG